MQPGKKIEISADELLEGDCVDVFLVVSKRADRQQQSVVELLASLPPGPHSYVTWQEVEQHFHEERGSWDA